MLRPVRVSRWLSFALLAALACTLPACGDDSTLDTGGREAAVPAPADASSVLEHIHGLGVDPAADALYVATHYGLFRTTTASPRLERVGESRQDIMGFSVVAPRRFLASGHPDPAQKLPPNLGLIESRDGGRSWKTISLLGKADFHVLRAGRRHVYGLNGATGKLMVSSDGGRQWRERRAPAPFIDLAVDPDDSQRIVVSTERGVFTSADAGGRWRLLPGDSAGLLAWPAHNTLMLIDGRGRVLRSGDAGKSFGAVGATGAPPVAFAAGGKDLYAAGGEGTIVHSGDGGASWTPLATPSDPGG